MPHAKVVVLGCGFGGAYAARELGRQLGRDGDILVIDRNNYFVYYPLLAEAAAGTIEPRHVVVPVRKFLNRRARFVMGEIVAVRASKREVDVIQVGMDTVTTFTCDQLVWALGSITRLPDYPGLKQFGFQLKTLTDGIGLRDRAIELLEEAQLIEDRAEKRKKLRIVVVGGNFTGVELAGELQAFMTTALRAYSNLSVEDAEVVLVEHGHRILPALDERLAKYATQRMAQRGIRILTGRGVVAIGQDWADLDNGERVAAETVIWAAGIAPHPLLKLTDLPLNEKGYIRCEPSLRVEGFQNVWAIGDSATVMDAHGKPYTATAQNASRQGPHLARNIAALLQGREPKPFLFNNLGSFAAFGGKRAVARVLIFDLTGLLGWMVYRAAYLVKYPTFGLQIRLFLDWNIDLFLPYPPVQLGIRRNSLKPQENGREANPLD